MPIFYRSWRCNIPTKDIEMDFQGTAGRVVLEKQESDALKKQGWSTLSNLQLREDKG